MPEKTQMVNAVKGTGEACAAREESPMPRNVVGGGAAGGAVAAGEGARLPQLSEAEWRAQNMPATRLLVRWGYRNGQVQLLNRRMRNLAERRVGPAMCAWIRERVEWEAANRLHERPDGVIVVDVDPAGEGSVDVRVDALGEPPSFTRDMLDGGLPAGLHPWVVTADGHVRRVHAGKADAAHDEAAVAGAADTAHGEAAVAGAADAAHGEEIGAGAVDGDAAESAIDRFAADLAKTLGFAAEEAGDADAADTFADAADAVDTSAGSTADVAGYFATSEEWGLVPCAGDEDLEPVRKLAACFATLWSGKEGI